MILSFITMFAISLGYLNAFADDLNQFEKVPNDFYLAYVPDLPRTGPFRLSWGFYRPPFIWLQGQVVDISKIRWPQFDKEQVPPSISPESSMHAYVLIEDADGQVIDTLKLEKPFVPDTYSNEKGLRPAGYRIKLEAIPDRLFLTTKTYPWFKRKEIFKCEIPLQKSEDLAKNSRLKTCLQTIKNLAGNAKDQWFVKIEWPDALDNENRNFVSEQERELKGVYRKQNHVYQSERLPVRKFSARAGVTRSELVPTVGIEYGGVAARDLLSAVPEKEAKSSWLDKQTLADGSIVEAVAYPGDFVELREILMPGNAKPRVHIQFIPSIDGQLKLRKTPFHEIHTGLGGMMRPWQGSIYADYNSLSSNRGERSSLLDLPGFQFSYKSNYWDLVPYGYYQTGLIHTGSSLSISEVQVGLSRKLEKMPWASLFAGVHQYTLSGTNPGTSRLGKMEAVAAGVSGAHLFDTTLLRGRMNVFYSNTIGYEGLVEYGKLLERTTDFSFFYGVYLGYSRYASTLTNKIQIVETFSEDRLRIGVSFGFLGPDSF